VLQERVYRNKISDVGELKRRIKNEWADLNHSVIERAVTDVYLICDQTNYKHRSSSSLSVV